MINSHLCSNMVNLYKIEKDVLSILDKYAEPIYEVFERYKEPTKGLRKNGFISFLNDSLLDHFVGVKAMESIFGKCRTCTNIVDFEGFLRCIELIFSEVCS